MATSTITSCGLNQSNSHRQANRLESDGICYAGWVGRGFNKTPRPTPPPALHIARAKLSLKPYKKFLTYPYKLDYMDTEIFQAQEYISLYTSKYNNIIQHRPRWLTISPPYDDKEQAQENYEYWIKKLVKLKDIASDAIIITEMSTQCRLHYHIIYSLKDPIKEYKYLNGWRKEAQVRVYNGQPKEGVSYLFKDISFTKEYLPNAQLIHTRTSIMEWNLERKRALRQRKKVQSQPPEPDNSIMEYVWIQ